MNCDWWFRVTCMHETASPWIPGTNLGLALDDVGKKFEEKSISWEEIATPFFEMVMVNLSFVLFVQVILF